MTHKANLALFLNLSVMQLFVSNIRIYASYLWAVIISKFFDFNMKSWSDRGFSSVIRPRIKSYRFDLLYIRYHSCYDVGVETEAF